MKRRYYNEGTQYHTLCPEEIQEIHLTSCRILETVGMKVHHKEAIGLLKKAGAYVSDDGQAFVPTSLVEWAVKSAPKRITIYDRDENPVMYLGKSNVYFGTGSDTEAYVDFVSKKRFKWTKADVEDAMRLCNYLKNIDFVMSIGMISDIDIRMNTREQYAVMIRKSRKPQVVVCNDSKDLKDIINMAAVVRGGFDNLEKKPFFLLYCEPTSPLKHSFTVIDKLLLAAENKIPTNYAAGGMAGATTPITAAGTLALNNAECLFGLVVHQLKNPGAPFVYGFGNSPMDMWTMQAAYATPLAIQISGGMCDLAKFYGLPSWGEAGSGCSKICDQQAVMEASQFILMAALQGCNVIHDIGYLEFGLSFSLELLVISDEIIDRSKHIIKKVKVNDEYLGLEAIKRVGHSSNYLGDEHTYRHLKENWRGNLSDFRPYDAWAKDGFLDMGQQAHQYIKQILKQYFPDPLPKEIDRRVEKILEEARNRSNR